MTRQRIVLIASLWSITVVGESRLQAEPTGGIVVVFDTSGSLNSSKLTEQIDTAKVFFGNETFFAQDGSLAVGVVAYGRSGAADVGLIELDELSLSSALFPAFDAVAAEFPVTGQPRKRFEAIDAARAMLSTRTWASGHQAIIHFGQEWTHPQPKFTAEVTDAATTEQPIIALGFSESSIALNQAVCPPETQAASMNLFSTSLASSLNVSQQLDSCGPGPGPGPGPGGCTCAADSYFCTLDYCNSSGVCVHPSRSCDDSNICTDDSCDETNDVCMHTPNYIPCNDGNACTGEDGTCDSEGVCSDATPITCDDSDACTDNACDTNTGCIFTPITCDDDGIACTTDSCDTISGCVFDDFCCQPAPADDCNQNTVLDYCDISRGTSADSDGDGLPDECEPGVDENGFVQQWAIIGPFAGFDLFDGLAGGCGYTEQNMEPSIGDLTQGLTWSAATAIAIGAARAVDFEAVYPGQDDVSAYAHSYVYSPVTRDVTVTVDADSAFELFVDGTSLIAYGFTTPTQQDAVVALTKGWHRVLMHVANDASDTIWEASLRITDSVGNPWTDLVGTPSREGIPSDEGLFVPSNVLARPPAILDWLVLGPFAASGCDISCPPEQPAGNCVSDCTGGIDLLSAATGGVLTEPYAQPVSGETAAGTSLTWTSLASGTSVDFSDARSTVDLNEYFGFDGTTPGQIDHSAYLHTYITNYAPNQEVRIVSTAGAAVTVWVDGARVADSCNCSASDCTVNTQESGSFNLAPGTSSVLVRVDGSTGDWDASVAFAEGTTAAPPSAVTFSLDPLGSTSAVGDCNNDGISDSQEIQGGSADCNDNGVPDYCDIGSGASIDCDGDGVPSECGSDCDGDGIPSECEDDCDNNGIADDCELGVDDCNNVRDACEDCVGSEEPFVFSSTTEFTSLVDTAYPPAGPHLRNIDINTPGELQIAEGPHPDPVIWVACSTRGTVVKIATQTFDGANGTVVSAGTVLGEYRTAPEGHGTRNPSRTTVDLNGNAWIANRDVDQNCPNDRLSVTCASGRKCGSVVRVDDVCFDRRETGFLTSTTLGDILEWAGTDISTAQDDCIGVYTLTAGVGTRALAVDPNNDLWVGSFDGHDFSGEITYSFEKLSGVTGAPIPGTVWCTKCAGYGGLMDRNGVLWFSPKSIGVMRFDPNAIGATAGPCCVRSTCISDCGDGIGSVVGSVAGVDDCLNEIFTELNITDRFDTVEKAYGIALNPQTGNILVAESDGNLVELSATEYGREKAKHGLGSAQGVAVDRWGHVWVAQGSEVRHFINSTAGTIFEVGRVTGPEFLDPVEDEVLVPDQCVRIPVNANGVIGQGEPSVCVESGGSWLNGATGVAVDRAGKIWVTERGGNRVSRIDPNAGPKDVNDHYVGVVDLQIELGNAVNNPGQSNPPLYHTKCEPYNYSDMTGFQLLAATPGASWAVVLEGPAAATKWSKISWTEVLLPGTGITVEARARSARSLLGDRDFIPITNGGDIGDVISGLYGRYIEVRVTLSGQANPFATPSLQDITVEYECPKDCNGAGGWDYCEILADGTLDANSNGVLDACEAQPVIQLFPVDELGQIVDGGAEISGPVSECVAIGFQGSASNGDASLYSVYEWDVTGDGLDPALPDVVGIQFIEDFASDSSGAPCDSDPTNTDCKKKTVALRATGVGGSVSSVVLRDIEVLDTVLSADDIRIQGSTSVPLNAERSYRVLINELCDSIATVEWDFDYDGTFDPELDPGSGLEINSREVVVSWNDSMLFSKRIAVRVTEDDEEDPDWVRPIAELTVTLVDEQPQYIPRSTDLAVETRFHYHTPFPTPGSDVTHSMQMRVVNRSATEEARTPIYVGYSAVTPTNAALATGDWGGLEPLPTIGSYIELVSELEDSLRPDESSPWVTIDWLVPEADLDEFGFTANAYAGQHPPAFELDIPPIPLATEGEPFVYTVAVTDADGDGLFFELGDEPVPPTTMALNALSGVIAWTPGQEAGGTGPAPAEYSIPLIVKDGYSESRTDLPIQVAPVNVPPIFTSVPETIAIVGGQYLYSPDASDADGTSPTIAFTSSPVPPQPNGELVWTPELPDANRTFPVVVTATDDEFEIVQEYEISVLACASSDKPVITRVDEPPDAHEGLPYTLQIGLDQEPADTDVYYFLDAGPDDMMINHETGLIQWTPSYRSAGSAVIRVVASTDADGYFGCADSEVFQVTILDRHTSPIVTLDPILNATEGIVTTMRVLVSDEDGDLPHSYYLIDAPPDMRIEPHFGLIEWTPSQTAAAQYDGAMVTVDVSDPAGFWGTAQFALSVTEVDVPPSFESEPLTFAAENSVYNYTVLAEDLDDPSGQSLSFELGFSTTALGISFGVGAEANLLTWDLSGDFTAAFTNPHHVSVIVYDGPPTTSNSIEQEFDIWVRNENAAPTFDLPLQCATVTAEGATYRCLGITATDLDNGVNGDIPQDTLVFTIDNPLPDMSIQPETGEIVWVVPGEFPGAEPGTPENYEMYIEVSDGVTKVTLDPPLSLQVDDIYVAPVISATPPLTIRQGQTYIYDIEAQSPESGAQLAFMLDVSPLGMTIGSSSGAITWDTASAAIGPHDILVMVDDVAAPAAADATTYYAFRVEVLPASAPSIQADPEPVAVATVGTEYVTNIDADPENLSWQLIEAPAGAAIDPFTPTASQAAVTWRPTVDQIGTHEFVVAVDDGTHSDVLVWSVTASMQDAPDQNHAPTFTSLPLTKGRAASPYTYAMTASDVDTRGGDALSFELLRAPFGMVIDPLEGPLSNSAGSVVVWNDPRVGTHDVVIRVGDSRGGSAEQEFQLAVSLDGLNTSPVIISEPPTTWLVNTPFYYQVDAFDPDQDPLQFSVQLAPAGLEESLTVAGLFEWTPSVEQIGPNWVTLRVEDGFGGTETQHFVVTVYDGAGGPNHSPTIASAPPSSATANEQLEYLLMATDLETPASDLRYSILRGPPNMIHELDPLRPEFPGRFIWTPSLGQVGMHSVVVRIDDGDGGWASQEFDILVSAGHRNRPPEFASMPPLSGIAGRAYVYSPVIFDADGDEVLIRLQRGPAGMTVADPVSGLLRWTPDSCADATHNVVLLADDGGGGVARQEYPLTVGPDINSRNVAPVITSIPLERVSIDSTSDYVYQVRAFDADQESLEFALWGAPRGMVIDSTTGLITWPDESLAIGSHDVEIRVRDALGGSARQAFALTVYTGTLNHSPLATSTPPVLAIVGSLYSFVVNVFDEDELVPTGTFAFLRKPAGAEFASEQANAIEWIPEASQSGTHEFAVVYTDTHGASVTQRWNVTVSPFGDNRAPAITSVAPNRADSASTFVYDVGVFDDDGDLLTFTLLDEPEGMTIDRFSGRIYWDAPSVGTHSVALRVEDEGHARSEQRFSLAVSPSCDGSPPHITSSAPSTIAAGSPYEYRVNAIANGSGTLSFDVVQQPPTAAQMSFGAGVDADLLSWDTTGLSDGTYTARIRVSETPTLYAEETFEVTVSSDGANQPPRIISTPIVSAVAYNPACVGCPDRTYRYAVAVEDDGDPPSLLTYSVTAGFAPVDGQGTIAAVVPGFAFGADLDPAHVLSWEEENIWPSTYSVTISVADAEGAMATQSYLLTVSGNRSPRILSDPPALALIYEDGQPCTDPARDYKYEIKAYDPDDTATTVSFVSSSPGMTLSGNTLTWAQCDFVSMPGRYPVTIEVTDGEATTKQAFTVHAATWADYDKYPPIVEVTAEPFVAAIGEPVTIAVHATDDTGIPSGQVNLRILTPGSDPAVQFDELVNEPLDLDGNRVVYEFVPEFTGGYQVIVTAADFDPDPNDGVSPLEGSGRADFFVPREGDVPLFRLDVCTPALDAEVSDETVAITGFANSTDFFKYTLEYRLIGTEEFELFHTQYTVVDGEGSSCEEGPADPLGTLDTTQMPNGIYEIWVRIWDIAGFVQGGYTQFAITNKTKIGNLQLAFTDLDIPLGGLPVTVTRAYDSRKRSSGDFGAGWQLGVSTMRLEENTGLGEEWLVGSGGLQCFVQPAGQRYVTVTWPDDRVEFFNLSYRSEAGQTLGCTGLFDVYDIALRNADSGGSSLRIRGSSSAPVLNSDMDRLTNSGGFSENTWEPLSYELTSQDGTRYIFEKPRGSRVAKVRQVVDRNNNVLTFLPGGMKHSLSDDPDDWVVRYVRDSRGRITEIRDPMWFADNTRGTLRYRYDDRGDLVEFVNQVDDVTRFIYDDKHRMTDIIGPDGRKVAHNVFDDTGRLIAHVDADGLWIEYTHDADGRQETITDRLGNPRIYVYDDDGNVTAQTDTVTTLEDGESPLVTTLFEYDARGNLTKTILPDNTPSNDDNLYTERTYDDRDNLLTERDRDGNVTTYTYTPANLVRTVTDARGNVTENEYDGNGNLTTVTRRNPAGDDEVTTYTYLNGNRVSARDPLGNTTRFEYYSSGLLKKEISPLLYESTFEYDACNRLTKETRPVGPDGSATATTENIYDDAGRLVQRISAEPEAGVGGVVTTTTYTLTGKTASVETPDGTTRFEYDSRGNLVKTIYADNSTMESEYDAEGRQTRTKDRDGVVTSFVHDELGRVIKTYLPDATPGSDVDGPFTETVYDRLGRVVEKRVEDDDPTTQLKTTTYAYSPRTADALASQTVTNFVTVDGVVAQYETKTEFDASGNSVKVEDARGNVTNFEYDFAGRLVKTIFADGLFSSVTYDRAGRKTGERDRAGVVTQFAYDAVGRLTSVTDAQIVHGQPGVTTYTYDAAGNLLTQTDAGGRTTSMTYDALGQMRSRTLPEGGVPELWSNYDTSNRLTTHTDFNGNTTALTYGAEGRLDMMNLPDTSTAPASGHTVTYAYTSSGRRSFVGDPVTGGDSYGYFEDPLVATSRGLLRVETKANGQRLEYDYDARGNRTSVTTFQDSGNTIASKTDYAYDELNRLVLVTEDPSGAARQTHYRYDEVGNRSLVRYPNGTCTKYEYDDLNRLTRLTNRRDDAAEDCVNGALLSDFVYTLGDAGNRTQVVETIVEADGTLRLRTVNYTYDNLYRLLSETVTDNTDQDNQNRTVHGFTYDRVGNRLTETILASEVVDGVTTVTTSTATTYVYDDNDRMLTKAWSNALVDNVHLEDLPHYAHAGSMPSRWAAHGLMSFSLVSLAALLTPLALSWPRKRRSGVRRRRRSLRHRCIAAFLVPLMAFGPERVLALHQEAAAHRAMSDALAAAVLAQVGQESWTYSYDANGNMIRRENATRADEYHYDAQNRLLGRDDVPDLLTGTTPVPQVTYGYDADGVRKSMTDAVAGVLTTYLTDKNRDYAQVLVDTKAPGTGETVTKYVYGDDLISQERADGAGPATVSYYHYDGQLSTRQLTNAAGTTTDTYTFEAFGTLSASTTDDGAATANNYLYTGEQYDPNVGFYYLRARYYDQTNGRFATTDAFAGLAFEPGSLHKYLYVGADPVNHIDPTGNFQFNIGGILASVVVRVMLFMLRHPVLTGAIGFALNLILPQEVHEAMLTSGVPGFQGLGAIGTGRARVFKLFTNKRLSGYIQRLAPTGSGKFWQQRGKAFEEFLGKSFFPNAQRNDFVTTGRNRADFEWLGRIIEAKAGLNWDENAAAQLAAHAQYALDNQRDLVYMFVVRPSSAAGKAISNAGGTVFYLFDR